MSKLLAIYGKIIFLKYPFGQFRKHFELVLFIFYENNDSNLIERRQLKALFFHLIWYDKIFLTSSIKLQERQSKRSGKKISELKHSFYGIILLDIFFLTRCRSAYGYARSSNIELKTFLSGIRNLGLFLFLLLKSFVFWIKVIVHEMVKQMLTPTGQSTQKWRRK